MITTIEKDGAKVLHYEWQPTLEDKTPIGGVQVVEAPTQEELIEKFRNNYDNLYRRNRELMRAKELQPPPQPAEPPKPAVLTPEERLRVIEGELRAARAVQDAAAWADDHPNFHRSQKNREDLANWIQVRGLDFTYANFDKAFEALQPALEVAPPSVPETPAKPPETQTPSRIAGADESGTQPQTKIPSPVSRRQSSSSGAVEQKGLTLEQIRRMPAAEYKKKLSDPKFVAEVNALFSKPTR